jgi:hypothetical protein
MRPHAAPVDKCPRGSPVGCARLIAAMPASMSAPRVPKPLRFGIAAVAALTVASPRQVEWNVSVMNVTSEIVPVVPPARVKVPVVVTVLPTLPSFAAVEATPIELRNWGQSGFLSPLPQGRRPKAKVNWRQLNLL